MESTYDEGEDGWGRESTSDRHRYSMKPKSVRIITVAIRVPFSTAYEFARQPENFPKWATGLAGSLAQTERGWVASTPNGKAVVRFAPQNEFGVLDHSVQLEGKPEIYVPLRMVQNGEGTQVELMLFRQADVSDEGFNRDTKRVEDDLRSLKKLLEA